MKRHLLFQLSLLCSLAAVAGASGVPQRVGTHVVTRSASAKPVFKAVKSMNPALASEAGPSLYESFECPDKTFPEGWTLDLTNDNDWMIYAPGMYGITTTDGSYAASATCLTGNDGKQQLHEASWLVSPEIVVKPGEQLDFDLYFDVRSLYVWTTTGDDKTIDEEDGLILNRINAENMKICISVDGGEWVVLKNLWEEYGKLGYWDIIYDYAYQEFHKFSIPLTEYEGKTVKIGFCHSYLDERGGHGMFLDAVKVSLPPVEASYSLPFGTLFWGMSNDLLAMPSWVNVPYYTDLYWTNETYADGATYKWEYSSYNDEETISASDMDLVTNFKPDYSLDPEARYTMFTFPTLSASTESGSTGSYTYADGEGIVFAGISAELPTTEDGMMSFGLSTFDQADDVQLYNADFDVPAWGHNAMTQDWWTNHYFKGMQGEGDYAKITSNINFFYSNGAPLVINGVRVAACAVFEDDAEFTMDIVALNEDFTLGDVIASAKTKGSDVLKIDDTYANYPNSVMIGFKFDKPVVVDGINFIARISGFDSDKVEYYSPLQSYKSAPLCYGFSTLEICAPSMGYSIPGESMMPTAVFEDLYNSFAIYLDGYYPYLKCEESEFEFTSDVTEKTFVFDSSYLASELSVTGANGEVPSWLEIEKSGSYGATNIVVKAVGGVEAAETAVLEVSAPGVSHKLTVKPAVTSGISQIAGTSPVAERILFDLSGRRISAAPASGAYIVHNVHADGSVTVEKLLK